MKRLGLEFNWYYVPLGMFILLRGYFEWGWWYPPLILAGGMLLAVVVGQIQLHRQRRATRKTDKAHRQIHHNSHQH